MNADLRAYRTGGIVAAVAGAWFARASAELNPDSAVAIDRKREAQPFSSKDDGYRHRS